MKLDLNTLDADELQALSKHLTFEKRHTAVLSSFKEGEAVSVEGIEETGVIVSLMTSDFEFPVGEGDGDDPETQTIEASSDDPVYVVTTIEGPVAVSEDQITSDSFDVDVSQPEDDVKKLAKDAEEAGVYSYMDDYHDPVELREAKKKYILDMYADELSESYADMDYEELVNIRGVKDPHVGFADWPPSWKKSKKPARVIAMHAWAKLGGTWTSCVTEMTGEISNPKRFCAAFKDEILQTTHWRNRF